MIRSMILLTCVLLGQAVHARTAQDSRVRWPKTWISAASAHALDPALLYSLALAVNKRRIDKQAVAPWPWAVAADGTVTFYETKEQAAAAITALPQEHTDMKIGFLQIDVERWAHRFRDPLDLLDPVANLDAGATILAQALRALPGDPAVAIGSYRYPGFAQRSDARAFGDQVLALARALSPQTTPVPPVLDTPMSTCGSLSPSDRSTDATMAIVELAARRHGIDPAYALAIAEVESGFRQTALSRKGAQGVMQLMPATAVRYNADASDTADNVDAGVRYLRDLALMFGGDPLLVAAGYNAGERAVIHYGGVPPFSETKNYVPRVMAARNRYASCKKSAQ